MLIMKQIKFRINDKGNDIIVELLDSFSFKSIIPLQNKFKTPAKKHNKSLHQQYLLLNDTDVIMTLFMMSLSYIHPHSKICHIFIQRSIK